MATTGDVIDDATVQIYRAKMAAAWQQYEAIQRDYHDAYVAWQICAMECKYVNVPRSENGEPASILQRMEYGHSFHQRLNQAETALVSCEKSAVNAKFKYEAERIKISKKFDDDLLEVTRLVEEEDE